MMGIIQTTLSKFISTQAEEVNTYNNLVSHDEISKHFCIRKGDLKDIFSQLEWIDYTSDTPVITEKGEIHGAQIGAEQSIMWEEHILRNEMLIYEINLFINDIFVYKVS